MRLLTLPKPNWRGLAAVVFCAGIWMLAVDGSYRVTHDNGHGIRRAVQAKAAKAANTLRGWMA